MNKNIIIVGARGFRYNYGGWETFVTNLVLNYKDKKTKFYIPDLITDKKKDKQILIKNDVICPQLYVKNLGFITMFTFTIKSIRYFKKYIKKEHLENTILYILGCKVGPLLLFWKYIFHRMGVKIIINPDGLEWKRDKWSWWIKQCFKISERTSIKASDYCVCDSLAILDYVNNTYQKYHTPSHYIAYGAYLNTIKLNKEAKDLFKTYNIKPQNYYLIVGRFIPENNYETIISEFMKTKIKKDLVIICNLQHDKFYEHLKEKTKFLDDKRIKFIGSVYNQDTLKAIRKEAYAYIHGHSAGGTNPSLLEALSQTKVNILFDVPYNKEVGLDTCFYFNKENNNLKNILLRVEKLTLSEQDECHRLAKERIKNQYTWDLIVDEYDKLFTQILSKK